MEKISMKTKKYLMILVSVISFFIITGCGNDNPVESRFSLEEQINVLRPLKVIGINYTASGMKYSYGEGYRPFTDAVAKNGYLIITFSDKQEVYSLKGAKEVEILSAEKTVTLIY